MKESFENDRFDSAKCETSLFEKIPLKLKTNKLRKPFTKVHQRVFSI